MEFDPENQPKHFYGTGAYYHYQSIYHGKGEYGPSYLTISEKEVRELVDQYAGTGIIQRNKDGSWRGLEIVTTNKKIVGRAVNNMTGKSADSSVFVIKYDKKKGIHVYPDYPSKFGTKSRE